MSAGVLRGCRVAAAPLASRFQSASAAPRQGLWIEGRITSSGEALHRVALRTPAVGQASRNRARTVHLSRELRRNLWTPANEYEFVSPVPSRASEDRPVDGACGSEKRDDRSSPVRGTGVDDLVWEPDGNHLTDQRHILEGACRTGRTDGTTCYPQEHVPVRPVQPALTHNPRRCRAPNGETGFRCGWRDSGTLRNSAEPCSNGVFADNGQAGRQ